MDAPDDSPYARFGAQLRGLRMQAGLSVRRLADELHRAHSGIVEYERGIRLPGVEVVEQYEDYFKLPRGTLVAQRERARAEGLERPPDGTLDEHLGDIECPYKGLRPFESADAALFFGREGQIEDVLTRVAATRFVAVVGASGSGKSSFVRAGLLAGLLSTAAGAGTRAALLTPGAHPLEALAGAVGAAGGASVSPDDLRADPDALARVTCASGHPPIAIAVDQFEELFTLCDDEAERRCFVAALVGAWRDPSSRVVVMLALRADFYGRVAAYPELAAAVVAHQALIGPMGTADLRRAVELPAASSGLVLQPGLVETILEDLAGEPGSLPLLSHALLETWKRRRRLQLTVSGYREAGGVRGAIAQTAEQTLQELPDGDRAVARSIFLSLTDVNEGAEPVGRRVELTELAAQPGAGDAPARVLGVLADARLVSIDEHTVVVAHEALIRHWPRLRGWIEADRAGLVVHRRLQQAAREWEGLDRDPGAVYRGARLAAAQEWAVGRPDDLSGLERAFLAASEATEQRTTRRRRLLLGVVSAALGISVVLGVVAYLQARDARSQAFAARAIDAAETDPEAGLRLALQAAELGHGGLVQRALHETLGAAGWARILRTGRRLALNDVAFSPDGRLAVTGGDEGAATLWATGSGRRVATLRHDGPIRTVRFSANGSRIVTASDDGVARIWDVAGRMVRELPVGGRVRSAAFDRAGGRVITASADGDARVWDLAREADPVRLAAQAEDPLDVTSFSDDGTMALTSGPPGELRVWTLSSRPRARALRLGGARPANVTVATFSSDARQVLAGDASGRVCLWTLRGGARSCHALGNAITDVSFSRDGTLYVAASLAGTAELGRTAGYRPIAPLRHDGPVNAASFATDGKRVLTAGADRFARVWGIDGRLELELGGHTDTIAAARFSTSGGQVLTGSDDGSARVWATRPDRGTLPDPPMPDADVAFSPDSRSLLAVDADGHAAIWDLERGTRTTPRGEMVGDGSGLLACDRWTGCGPWSRDSRSVAGADAALGASVWDAESGEPRSLGVGGATGAAFARDGTRLAIVRDNGPAVTVDRAGKRLAAAVPRGLRTQVASAAFTRDGRRLLTVDVNGEVRLSDAATGGPAGPKPAATVAVTGAAAVSPDGSLLAIGTRAGVLEVLRSGSPTLRSSASQGSLINTVAFDSGGERIVTAHDDGSARVWDAGAPGDAPVVLRGPEKELVDAEFSPDGRLVLTSSIDDGTARLWDPVLGTSILVLSTSDRGRARFDPDGRLIAIGGRRTVEVRACELCASFDELVRSARARLPPR